MQFATRGLLLCVALASAVHPTPRDIIMSSLPMKNDDSGEHIDIDWFDRDLTGHLHRSIMEHETESRGACEQVSFFDSCGCRPSHDGSVGHGVPPRPRRAHPAHLLLLQKTCIERQATRFFAASGDD